MKIIDYVVRTEFDCHLQGDVFLTPFEIINLHLSITIQTVVLDPKLNDGRRINIKFNCMNSDKVTTIDSTTDCEFGTYSLADYYLDSDYSNSSHHRFLPISVLDPEKKKNTKNKKVKTEKEGSESKQMEEEEENSDVKIITG